MPAQEWELPDKDRKRLKELLLMAGVELKLETMYQFYIGDGTGEIPFQHRRFLDEVIKLIKFYDG